MRQRLLAGAHLRYAMGKACFSWVGTGFSKLNGPGGKPEGDGQPFGHATVLGRCYPQLGGARDFRELSTEHRMRRKRGDSEEIEQS